jgi:orotate phosphoribosyltransferase
MAPSPSSIPAIRWTGTSPPVPLAESILAEGEIHNRHKDRPMIPSTYPPADEIARLTARMLLEIGAVHFNADEPYIYSSGLPGPTYIDCRKLISYPRIRSTLMDFLAITVMRNAGFEAFDNVAGGETAGMALPMTYVRKKPKGHGRGARIEGTMTEGQRVLLVEDLTTDGGSKIGFVDAIRETGATCAHTAVIFYYGIFPDTVKTLGDHGVALHHLCTWWDVLAEARAQGTFDDATLAEVEAFLKAPRAWQDARR